MYIYTCISYTCPHILIYTYFPQDHEIDSAGGALYQRKKNPTKRTRDSDADSD